MTAGGESWWLPGVLIALLAVLCLVGAAFAPMPDAVGGWIFGGVLLLAALTSLSRRAPRRGARDPHD